MAFEILAPPTKDQTHPLHWKEKSQALDCQGRPSYCKSSLSFASGLMGHLHQICQQASTTHSRCSVNDGGFCF